MEIVRQHPILTAAEVVGVALFVAVTAALNLSAATTLVLGFGLVFVCCAAAFAVLGGQPRPRAQREQPHARARA